MIYINFILIDIMINKEVHLRDIILPFHKKQQEDKKEKEYQKKGRKWYLFARKCVYLQIQS